MWQGVSLPIWPLCSSDRTGRHSHVSKRARVEPRFRKQRPRNGDSAEKEAVARASPRTATRTTARSHNNDWLQSDNEKYHSPEHPATYLAGLRCTTQKTQFMLCPAKAMHTIGSGRIQLPHSVIFFTFAVLLERISLKVKVTKSNKMLKVLVCKS